MAPREYYPTILVTLLIIIYVHIIWTKKQDMLGVVLRIIMLKRAKTRQNIRKCKNILRQFTSKQNIISFTGPPCGFVFVTSGSKLVLRLLYRLALAKCRDPKNIPLKDNIFNKAEFTECLFFTSFFVLAYRRILKGLFN